MIDYVVIEGYRRTRYKIFDNGTVISLGRTGARGYIVKDKELKQHMNSNGYLRVALTLTERSKMYYVHRLVAKYFVENPDARTVINHKDGNKCNNDYRNLEWVTSGENNKHAFDLNLKKPTVMRGEKHGCHKLTNADVAYIRSVHCPWHKEFSSKALGEKFGVRPQTITDIVHGRSRKGD